MYSKFMGTEIGTGWNTSSTALWCKYEGYSEESK